MGLSRIRIAIQAATGGIGPTGPTGPTGNTGNYVTGPDGIRGYGISSVTYNSALDGITFTFENGLSAFFTGIKGNTGFNPGFPEIGYTGSGDRFLNNIGLGFTFLFRGISFSSGLSASISSNTIYIENNTGDTGSFVPNKLLVVKYNATQQKYYLDSSINADYKDVEYSGISYSSLATLQRTPRDILDFNNFNYSTGSSQSLQHIGLTLGIDAAFYGMTGTENDLKVSTWTPYLRYRTSYADFDGNSGITVGTIKFDELGPFNKTILLGTTLGSCCLCGPELPFPGLNRICLDYVNKDYCDFMLGRFSLLSCYQRQDTNDCYRKRACCVNGRCINTSSNKCTEYVGQYFQNDICGVSFDCSIDTTSLQDLGGGCCCTQGVPIFTADPNLCGGPLYPPGQGEDCSQIQCCGTTGACCLPSDCVDGKTPEECAALNGIFRGRDTICSSVTCPT